MLTSIEGTYRDGQIVLKEPSSQMRNETPVIVTFIGANEIDLRTEGIDQDQAATLHSSLATFQNWQEPEMDIYDDYDNAKLNQVPYQCEFERMSRV